MGEKNVFRTKWTPLPTGGVPYPLGIAQSCAKRAPFRDRRRFHGGMGAVFALKGAVTGKMVPFMLEGRLHVREGVASV